MTAKLLIKKNRQMSNKKLQNIKVLGLNNFLPYLIDKLKIGPEINLE